MPFDREIATITKAAEFIEQLRVATAAAAEHEQLVAERRALLEDLDQKIRDAKTEYGTLQNYIADAKAAKRDYEDFSKRLAEIRAKLG